MADRNPYLGLRHYEIDDAVLFFGRDGEAWQLESRILASRLLLVHGPSGAGKSSLVRAGALARIGPETAQVLPVGRPPRPPLPEPEAGLNPLTFGVLSSWAPDVPPAELRGQTIEGFLAALPAVRNRYDEDLPLVAVIDQCEEIFRDRTRGADLRRDFFADLAGAIERVERLRLVLVFDETAFADMQPWAAQLWRRQRMQQPVQPLDREAALAAVVEPLALTGRRFAPDAAEELVSRLLTGERVDPTRLQVACSDLWRHLPDDVTTITLDEIPDRPATVQQFCAHAVTAVAAAHGMTPRGVWTWLQRTFVNDLGGRASAYQGVAFVGGMPNLVARAFKEQGVLRSDVHDGSEWLELAHDALIAPILQVDPAAPREAAPEWEPQEYLALARQALAQGQVARADSYARRVVTDSRGSPATLAEGFALLGRLATLQARTANARAVDDHEAAAENHFQRALELFESGGALHGAASMLRALGELYRDRGRLADALGVLQAAVAHSPGDVTLKVDLARVLSDTGQRPAALSVYREVLAVAEDHPEALVGQATVLATNGDPAAVLADLDRAVRAHPELADRPDVIELRLTARRRLDEGRP